MSEGMWSARQIARHLGVTDRTFMRWHASGKIPQPDQVGENGKKLYLPETVRYIEMLRLETLPRRRDG